MFCDSWVTAGWVASGSGGSFITYALCIGYERPLRCRAGAPLGDLGDIFGFSFVLVGISGSITPKCTVSPCRNVHYGTIYIIISFYSFMSQPYFFLLSNQLFYCWFAFNNVQ